MPRAEHDREDLLREATALVERAELHVAGCDAPVVVGFRRDGSFSVFFGGDPVYQFNSAGQLRRAYIDGQLYKAEQGRLVELRRERTPTQTMLIPRQLEADEESAVLAVAGRQLARLGSDLEEKQFTIAGQTPPDADLVGRICHWLAANSTNKPIAARPHIR